MFENCCKMRQRQIPTLHFSKSYVLAWVLLNAFPVLPGRQDWDGELHLPTIDYHRRRPENTALYQVVQRHYPTLVQICEQEGRPLPGFVVQEFEKFLQCGILAHGFARVRCCDCGYSRLVALDCSAYCTSCDHGIKDAASGNLYI